jgi:hypothetical protein
MALRTRMQPLAKNFLVAPGGALSREAGAQVVADIARTEIEAALAQDAELLGHAPAYETFVNGSVSARLDTVRPGQAIVALFEIDADVVQFVWDLIKASAPVLSGRFRDSQRLYADGVEVAAPSDCAGAKEVVILSIVPYARKIEGHPGRPPQSKQAPNGVYQAAAALAAARYGNIAKISFSFRNPVGGATMLEAWALPHAARVSERRRLKQYQRDTRQPAVIMNFG